MLGYAVPIVISLAPGLVVLVRVAGRSSSAWTAAVVGGGGWIMALVLRIPALLYARSAGAFYMFTASVLAGVFEEVARSAILRAGFIRRVITRNSLALGLGWGLTEALLVYAVPVGLSAPVYGYGLLDLLPGALERNSAILIHLSLTMLLARNPWSYRLLLASITLHSVANIVAVATLLTLENVWLVEIVVASFAVVLFTTIALPTLRYLRKVFEV